LRYRLNKPRLLQTIEPEADTRHSNRQRLRQKGCADIFFGNCFKNGMLPIVLDAAVVGALFDAVAQQPGYRLHIDLAAQVVTTPEGKAVPFPVDAQRKNCLLNGLDDIALTLERSAAIRSYEGRRCEQEPWLFAPQH
jgi:3-isopropylmalate/(R)-2-methylmalate dehydratase small subunit